MNEETPPDGAVRREDPCPAHTRDLVLQAARLIIGSDGQAAVTPTRLVELSGVARSTIYRHWDDPAAIIADAMSDDRQREMQLSKTGEVDVDLRTHLHQLRSMLESPAPSIIIAQAEVAERDKRASETLAANGRFRSSMICELLGDSRPDFAVVHAQLVGPLFMQRFFMRESISDDLIESVIASYLSGRRPSGN